MKNLSEIYSEFRFIVFSVYEVVSQLQCTLLYTLVCDFGAGSLQIIFLLVSWISALLCQKGAQEGDWKIKGEEKGLSASRAHSAITPYPKGNMWLWSTFLVITFIGVSHST